MSADAPDLAGFKAAQDRKRAAFGASVRFLWPAARTYAPGVSLNSDGEPLDPTVAPTSVDQPEATVTATVARQTQRITGQRSKQTAVGRVEKGIVQLNVALEDAATVDGAESFEIDGERYEIEDTTRDGLGPTPNRLLVTGRLET